MEDIPGPVTMYTVVDGTVLAHSSPGRRTPGSQPRVRGCEA